jgi:hypothetical protein
MDGKSRFWWLLGTKVGSGLRVGQISLIVGLVISSGWPDNLPARIVRRTLTSLVTADLLAMTLPHFVVEIREDAIRR